MLESMRHTHPIDQIIQRIDTLLASTIEETPLTRPLPVSETESQSLREAERRQSEALMRVNHSGEITAQALYLGQAWVARDRKLASELREAAKEEKDHLQWCR